MNTSNSLCLALIVISAWTHVHVAMLSPLHWVSVLCCANAAALAYVLWFWSTDGHYARVIATEVRIMNFQILAAGQTDCLEEKERLLLEAEQRWEALNSSLPEKWRIHSPTVQGKN